MATINFESVGGKQGTKHGSSTVTGVNTSGVTGWNKDRVIVVTNAMSATLGISAGVYQHTGESANGDWTYRQVVD